MRSLVARCLFASVSDSLWPINPIFLSMYNLDVNFESEEHALIAYTALAVDKELQPDKVNRVMSVSNNKLSVHFEAIEARLLRASFSAFVHWPQEQFKNLGKSKNTNVKKEV